MTTISNVFIIIHYLNKFYITKIFKHGVEIEVQFPLNIFSILTTKYNDSLLAWYVFLWGVLVFEESKACKQEISNFPVLSVRERKVPLVPEWNSAKVLVSCCLRFSVCKCISLVWLFIGWIKLERLLQSKAIFSGK